MQSVVVASLSDENVDNKDIMCGVDHRMLKNVQERLDQVEERLAAIEGMTIEPKENDKVSQKKSDANESIEPLLENQQEEEKNTIEKKSDE